IGRSFDRPAPDFHLVLEEAAPGAPASSARERTLTPTPPPTVTISLRSPDGRTIARFQAPAPVRALAVDGSTVAAHEVDRNGATVEIFQAVHRVVTLPSMPVPDDDLLSPPF